MKKIIISCLVWYGFVNAIINEIAELQERYREALSGITLPAEKMSSVTSFPTTPIGTSRPRVPKAIKYQDSPAAQLNIRIFSPEYAGISDIELITQLNLIDICPAVTDANDNRIKERVNDAADIIKQFGLQEGGKLLHSPQYTTFSDERNIIRFFSATNGLYVIIADEVTGSKDEPLPGLGQLMHIEYNVLLQALKADKRGRFFFVYLSDAHGKMLLARAFAKIVPVANDSAHKDIVILALYYCQRDTI